MVDKRTHNLLSISLNVDHFSVFVIYNVENVDTHMYEVDNENKICNDFLLTLMYSFCK